jgi:glutaminyl-tRNA synthetase
VVSKRKLLELVEQGYVKGWDDPRMPTISGLRRKGCTPEALRNFATTIGIARRENVVDVALLDFHMREDLNKITPRVMAVLDPVKLTITNYEADREEWLEAENNPENEEAGFREIPFSKELFIEREDFRESANRKFFRLKLGGEVRLKNAYIVQANEVRKDSEGNILEILCTYDPKSKSGSGTPESLRKVKGTLHWVSCKHAINAEIRLYDRLFIDPTPDQHTDRHFTDFINPHSLETITGKLEPGLKVARPGDKFQFQRMGYFCADSESTNERLIFNRTVTLRDTWSKTEERL